MTGNCVELPAHGAARGTEVTPGGSPALSRQSTGPWEPRIVDFTGGQSSEGPLGCSGGGRPAHKYKTQSQAETHPDRTQHPHRLGSGEAGNLQSHRALGGEPRKEGIISLGLTTVSDPQIIKVIPKMIRLK